MFTDTKSNLGSNAELYRWLGRASGLLLFILWFSYVLGDLLRPESELPIATQYGQLAALVVVFLGYAVGWRNELIGGILSIAGTVAYFAYVQITTAVVPGLAAVMFAAPGVFYLLSRSAHLEETFPSRTS
jgi:hypothetical protein